MNGQSALQLGIKEGLAAMGLKAWSFCRHSRKIDYTTLQKILKKDGTNPSWRTIDILCQEMAIDPVDLFDKDVQPNTIERTVRVPLKFPKRFEERFVALLAHNRITMQELSEKSGIRIATLYSIRRGVVPKWDKFEIICKTLKVKPKIFNAKIGDRTKFPPRP